MANTNYAAPKVTKCGFISNSANGGGAMYNTSSASPVMTSCTFSGNTAGYRDGGGMFNTGSALPTVNNCTFNGNTASFGGGMYNDYGPANGNQRLLVQGKYCQRRQGRWDV